MSKQYKHVSLAERIEIEKLLDQGRSQADTGCWQPRCSTVRHERRFTSRLIVDRDNSNQRGTPDAQQMIDKMTY